MDRKERTELARRALAGYAHGPDAPIAATGLALRKAETARGIVLVEGISDQIAIETLAARRGRDLAAEAIAVLPAGGSGSLLRYLRQFGPGGERRILAGLCDRDAVETFRRALIEAGGGNPQTTFDMARLGFHVCVEDLEDELIRAVGVERTQSIIESQGDLAAFRTFRKQPEWQGRPAGDQLRRFLRSKARRHLRYARLLVEAADLDRIPPPLDAVLAHV